MRKLFLIVMFWGPIPLIFVDPFYGTILYAVVNIIRPEQLLWGDTSATGRIFLATQVATFTSWIIHSNKLKLEYTKLPFQIKIFVLMIIEMIIVYFYALVPAFSWRWTNLFIRVVLFCFLISKSINTTKKLELYYGISVLWWTLLAMWGIQQKFGGNSRMEGLGGVVLFDINDLSAVYMLYIPMGYYFMFSRNKLIKFLGVYSTLVFIIFIILGGSRGAFLALIGSYAYIFLRSPGTQKIKTLFALIVVGGLLVFIFILFMPPEYISDYTERLKTMLGQESEDTGEVKYESSASGRVVIWKAALFIYRTHPEYWLTGVGMNCFYLIYKDYHIDEIRAYLEPDEFVQIAQGGKQMHNTFLNFLLGGGLLVFPTYLFLIFYVIRQAHNIPKKYPKFVDGVNIHLYAWAIETGIIGFCIAVMFVTLEFIDFFYWTLTLSGVVANIGKSAQKQIELGKEDEEEIEEYPIRRRIYA
ncbi:O-antigen polymerase [Candidatus Vecturithrix granuli]|uniref:O-antigen polymerase n=1 Tax=Vecturithrix granuli TaxID=1499967 RepID=A0A081C4C2_VECG1|nr:O-antigen polymerase [Candidatus Vecturithrix granuli]